MENHGKSPLPCPDAARMKSPSFDSKIHYISIFAGGIAKRQLQSTSDQLPVIVKGGLRRECTCHILEKQAGAKGAAKWSLRAG
jgi:hypothetical protein